MNDERLRDDTNFRSTPSGPTKWVCPMYCSSVVGRIRSAKGILLIIIYKDSLFLNYYNFDAHYNLL